MKAEQFKPGEIVYHKLNGLKMLVDSVVRLEKKKKPLVKCEWHTPKGKFCDRVFKATSLMHIDPNNKTVDVIVPPGSGTYVGFATDDRTQ